MDNKTILITGGTGFIGRNLCKYILETTKAKKVISYSRRWDDSEKLQQKIGDNRLRVINGDIRDKDSLKRAMTGVDYVIHAAAYKSVPSAEYNPTEVVSVNIDGSRLVADAAIEAGVKRVLGISSDKAASPVNLYGVTKLAMEHIFTNYNNLGTTRFSNCRYGNVIGSTGSVIPKFQEMLKNNEKITVTNINMTRFWFPAEDAVKYVFNCLSSMLGGETFIPKLKSSDMLTLLEALSISEYDLIGNRAGEKIHEVMITSEEMDRGYDLGWTYIIKPNQHTWDIEWDRKIGGIKVNFTYDSNNADRYTSDELRDIISRTNVL